MATVCLCSDRRRDGIRGAYIKRRFSFFVLYVHVCVHEGMDERKIVGILYEQPFSCICCHELKWRRGVQNAIPDSEDLSEKVDADEGAQEFVLQVRRVLDLHAVQELSAT